MSIATGLVYTVLMCVACLALWRALQVEAGDADWLGPAFTTDILDPFFTDPFPRQGKNFRGTIQKHTCPQDCVRPLLIKFWLVKGRF